VSGNLAANQYYRGDRFTENITYDEMGNIRLNGPGIPEQLVNYHNRTVTLQELCDMSFQDGSDIDAKVALFLTSSAQYPKHNQTECTAHLRQVTEGMMNRVIERVHSGKAEVQKRRSWVKGILGK